MEKTRICKCGGTATVTPSRRTNVASTVHCKKCKKWYDIPSVGVLKKTSILTVIILLLSTQVFGLRVYILSRPAFVDKGLVRTYYIDSGIFDVNIPIKDVSGNWNIIDGNGVETENSMQVELQTIDKFQILDVVQEPNGLDLDGKVHVRSLGIIMPGAEEDFTLLIKDVEDNNSVNLYKVIGHDRTPPGGCK